MDAAGGEHFERFIEQGAFDGDAAHFATEKDALIPHGDEKVAERELFERGALLGMLAGGGVILPKGGEKRCDVLFPFVVLHAEGGGLITEGVIAFTELHLLPATTDAGEVQLDAR